MSPVHFGVIERRREVLDFGRCQAYFDAHRQRTPTAYRAMDLPQNDNRLGVRKVEVAGLSEQRVHIRDRAGIFTEPKAEYSRAPSLT